MPTNRTATAIRTPAAIQRADGVELPSWLRPGAVFLVTRDASPQFRATPPFRFRLIRIDTRPTYEGWAWTEGYVLDENGQAVNKREIFVKYNGLRHIPAGGLR